MSIKQQEEVLTLPPTHDGSWSWLMAWLRTATIIGSEQVSEERGERTRTGIPLL
jgi:hypothetical protein